MKTTETQSEYIIPTKKEPIFTAECDAFGYIHGSYKMWSIEELNTAGETFEVDFTRAIVDLHKWIKDSEAVHDYPKCKFTIRMIDGTVKDGEYVSRQVYSISASKAKKFLL